MSARPLGRTWSIALRPWVAPVAVVILALAGSPAAAQGHGDSVWVNLHSGQYHCPGSHSYGVGSHRQFMTEAAAVSHGYKPAKGVSCAARTAAHASARTAAGAPAHGDSVWVNRRSHEYRCPGKNKYGEGSHGVYMTEQAALAAGNRPHNGHRCH